MRNVIACCVFATWTVVMSIPPAVRESPAGSEYEASAFPPAAGAASAMTTARAVKNALMTCSFRYEERERTASRRAQRVTAGRLSRPADRFLEGVRSDGPEVAAGTFAQARPWRGRDDRVCGSLRGA